MSRVSFVGLLVGLVARVCGLGSLVGLVKLVVVPFFVSTDRPCWLSVLVEFVGLAYWLSLLLGLVVQARCLILLIGLVGLLIWFVGCACCFGLMVASVSLVCSLGLLVGIVVRTSFIAHVGWPCWLGSLVFMKERRFSYSQNNLTLR